MPYSSMIDAIGHTPLVRLELGGATVYAKLEMQNLFAMKDRVARQAICAARESGELAHGAPVIESSSGTMALGVALVGRALGHPVHIVTDPRIDPVTLAKLRALGCALHIVPKMTSHGWQSARLERLHELMARMPGAFWPRQYSNPQNPLAYQALAAELLGELGQIDVLVGAVGSGGSVCGTSRALQRSFPDLWVVGTDCVGSALFGQLDYPQRLQSGLGNSLVPPNLDHSLIDEVHWLNDREAYAATRALAAAQQIFGGNTSGSVYQVLQHVAARYGPDVTVVGIMADRGDRYVSTVYDDEYWQANEIGKLPMNPAPVRVEYGTQVSAWSYCFPNGAGDGHAGRELSGKTSYGG